MGVLQKRGKLRDRKGKLWIAEGALAAKTYPPFLILSIKQIGTEVKWELCHRKFGAY